MKHDSAASALQTQYLRHLAVRRRRILFLRILLLAAFLLLWEIAADTGRIDAFIFSSPSRLAVTMTDMLAHQQLLRHIGYTLGETLLSFAVSTVLGILLAMLLWRLPFLYEVTEPYWVALNSLPKSALAPILIVWFGNTVKTTVITSISLTIIVTVLTVLSGFRETEEEKLRLIYSMGGTKSQALRKVLLPGNIPVILNVLRVNIGLSLIGVIIGEFLSARFGLGYLIIYGSQIFRMNWVLLSILLLCAIAILLYWGLGLLGRRIARHFQ